MPSTSARWAIRRPLGTESDDVPADLVRLSDDIDAILGTAPPMTLTQRDALTGAALFPGRLCLNTTVGRVQVYSAGAWRDVTPQVATATASVTITADTLGDVTRTQDVPLGATFTDARVLMTQANLQNAGTFDVDTDPAKTFGSTFFQSFTPTHAIGGSQRLIVAATPEKVVSNVYLVGTNLRLVIYSGNTTSAPNTATFNVIVRGRLAL